tara:strand:+ start:1976 stop:3595 length:1620 start_codon:yes stop_codon:yes gene_type:complete
MNSVGITERGQCDKAAPPLMTLKTAQPVEHSEIPWWNQSVFYEVFVRSFADSTTGPLACDGIGDIQGLIENLDYLNDGDPATTTDLGVNALWLMPIHQSPSYHGYDVVDYYQVDEEYGTNEDFKRLIKAAHSRGIRIIIDLVLNHASMQHPYFLQGTQPADPYYDWFVWQDKQASYPSGPWQQPIWHDASKQAYYGIFWSGMPDWNYHNPEVTQEMHKVSRYWLEEMGADGFRLDAIRYLYEEDGKLADLPITHQWLKDYQGLMKSVSPEKMSVGEVWADTSVVSDYGADELDLTFQFDLATAILSGVNAQTSDYIRFAIEEIETYFDPGQYATFLTNHDQNRVMSQLFDEQKAKTAASLLLTLPGVPFIYYGEEIGMTGVKPDELIRTPMQWNAGPFAGFSVDKSWQQPNDDFEQKNVAIQSAQGDSLLSHYRNLIHIRQQHPALLYGATTMIDSRSDRVMSFMRSSGVENILVLINMSRKAMPVKLKTYELEEGTYQGVNLWDGTPVEFSVKHREFKISQLETIEPYGIRLIRFERN